MDPLESGFLRTAASRHHPLPCRCSQRFHCCFSVLRAPCEYPVEVEPKQPLVCSRLHRPTDRPCGNRHAGHPARETGLSLGCRLPTLRPPSSALTWTSQNSARACYDCWLCRRNARAQLGPNSAVEPEPAPAKAAAAESSLVQRSNSEQYPVEATPAPTACLLHLDSGRNSNASSQLACPPAHLVTLAPLVHLLPHRDYVSSLVPGNSDCLAACVRVAPPLAALSPAHACLAHHRSTNPR